MTSSFQVSLFFIFTAAGIFWGVVREAGQLCRFAFFKSKIVTTVTDFFVYFSCGIIFLLTSLIFASGAIRGYMVFGFLLGFAVERLSLGFLLAKQLEFIYNWFRNLFKRFSKTKLGKRLTK